MDLILADCELPQSRRQTLEVCFPILLKLAKDAGWHTVPRAFTALVRTIWSAARAPSQSTTVRIYPEVCQ